MGPLRTLVLILVLIPGLLGSPPVMAGPHPVRTLPVTLVTDRSFQEIPQWRGLAHSVVEQATRDLAEESGLRFRIEREVSWSPSLEAASLEEILDEAVRSVDRKFGLLAVFLGRRPDGFFDMEEMGLAYLGRPALIVLAPSTAVGTRSKLRDHLALYLRHELGHVFGIPHIRDRSVMNPIPDRMIPRFGVLALEILKANRYMNFNASNPFSGSDLRALRDVYLVLHGQGDMETGLLINLGTALNREKDFAPAREVFLAARARDQDAVGAHLGLAESSLALGDSLETRSILTALQPDSTWLTDELGWMGSLWMELEEWEAAHSLFTQALDRDGKRFAFLVNRGLAAYRMNHYEEAVGDYQDAIALNPDRPGVWFNLGLALNKQLRTAEAVEALQRFLELEPTGARAQEARSYIRFHFDMRR